MKHLLHSALLGLALTGPAMAQPTESYVLMLRPGLSLIANQLERGGNTVNEIMPVVPDGSTLHMLDPLTGTILPVTTYSSATASWSPAAIALPPGTGFYFENKSGASFPLTFTGTRRVPALPIPELYKSGVYLVSSQIPTTSFDQIMGALPCGSVTVFKYIGAGFDTYGYDADAGGWSPSVPSVRVGEAFFLEIGDPPCPGPAPFGLKSPDPKEVTCGTDWTFDLPTPRSPCDGPPPVISILSTVTNRVCPVLVTRTWEAVDACGARATGSQTVIVTDTTAPQLVCPADKKVECSSTWSFDAPTATDGCGGEVTVNILSTVTNGICPATIIRTWEAVDACGNRATCSQTVSVEEPLNGDLYVEDSPYNYDGPPDLGAEPDENMDGQQMWLSRAIWVHQDCAQTAGTYLTHENPRYGQTNCVQVRVSNRGKGVVKEAKLEVYVANASLGLSWPSGWSLIGIDTLPVIAPDASYIAQLRWWPEGTGHYCLLARIVSAEDPMAVAETNRISANVRTNNNLAWRNVNVMNLLLTTGESAQVRLKAVRIHPGETPKDPRPGEKPPRTPVTVVCKTEAIFHEGAGEATLNLGPWFKRWQDAGGHGHGFVIAGETALRITNTLARIEDIPMDEEEEAIINLVLVGPRPLPVAGTEHTCHVELTEEIKGEAVGGVNYGVRMRALHTDTDHDGVVDVDDPDDDGDGVPDVDDPDPLGEPDCPPSALTIRSVDGNMVLSWNGLGYRLERTSVITRAWRPIHGATSPFIVAHTEEQQFFRLVCH